jgi:hypothetical protein
MLDMFGCCLIMLLVVGTDYPSSHYIFYYHHNSKHLCKERSGVDKSFIYVEDRNRIQYNR